MATFYFSSSIGSNVTGDGSQVKPWFSFSAKKAGADALSPGDTCLFKMDDVWSQDELIADSNGTSGAHITINRWGSGTNDPTFRWSLVQNGWTQAGATEIYFKTGLFAWPQTIGVDGTSALSVWNGANNTLPRGTFFVNGTGSVYIRLSDGTDPAGHTIYVPPTYQSDGNRGIVRGSYTRGKFIDFNHIRVVYAQGKGMSLSQPDSTFNDCYALGCGADGFLFNGYTPNGEMADRSRAYRCIAEYCCAGANFYSGMGQAYTTGASYTWWIDCIARYNHMAGFDFLDYGSDTLVQYCGAVRCVADTNGRAQSDPSYDPGIYSDGANNILIWGCTVSGGGTGTGTAGNPRGGISLGSEHALTKPCHHIYVINNLCHATNWMCINAQNSTADNNIQDIYWINNTFLGYRAANSMVYAFANMAGIADCVHFRNNIFYGSGNYAGAVSNWMTGGAWQDTDYNLYFRTAGNTNIYSFNNGAQNFTLAQWQTQISDEAHSIFANPRFINDNEGSYDVRLQRTSLGQAFTSPAIGVGQLNPFILPSWIAAAGVLLDNGAVAGSTKSDGSATAPSSVQMDIGYHYPATSGGGLPTQGSLTSTNVEPASLAVATVNTVAVSFTTGQIWPATGKLVVTFSTSLGGGFVFNSGATTTGVFTSGGSGSFSVSIAANIITLIRSGGSNIAAATPVIVSLTNIANPPIIGATGVYAIKTVNSIDQLLDIDAAVSSDTIIAPASGYQSVTIENLKLENIGINS